jgi:hypothetical protein
MKDRIVMLYLLAHAVVACDGTAGGAPPPAPAPTQTTASVAPASPLRAASGAPATPPASASCGAAGQPDCPLKAWMRATLQPYLNSGGTDLTRLATSLDKLAAAAPVEYPRWGAIARTAAAAARSNKLDEVKTACADCHETYRAGFRATMQARRLF